MKKIKVLVVLALALGLVFSLTACSGGSKEDLKVGFVTDEGGIDDASFNQSTWEGVTKYCEEQGWVEGKNYTYLESETAADYISNLSSFGEEGYDVVVAAGYQFGDALAEVAPQYPDTNYVFIDGWPLGDNTVGLGFKANDGSALVGAAAATATKTGKVGFIGGKDEALIQSFEAGFEYGLELTNPDVELTVQYADSFVDSAKGQSMAAAMFDSGIDIIYCAAGGVGNGAIKEAISRNENGEEVYIIGVDKDQYELGLLSDGETSCILTSMMKLVNVGAYEMISAHYNDEFPAGQMISYGLLEGAVGIPESNPNLSDEVVVVVEDLMEAVANGEVEVPAVPADMR